MWLCWIPILTPSVDYPRRLNGFLVKQGDQASDGRYVFPLLLSDFRGDEKSIVEIFPDLTDGHVISIKVNSMIDIEVEKYLSNNNNNEEEIKKGIRGIVTQYIEKIISYHRSLRRSLIYSARDADNILTEFNKGLGEMIYAEHFLKLNKEWLDPQYCDDNRLSFCSASDSFQRMLSVFSSRLGKKNVDIAYAVIFLSGCIFLIGGISPFFKNAPVKNLFVHLFFLVSFLGSCWLITRPKK